MGGLLLDYNKRHLLKILCKNSRTPIIVLQKEIGVSYPTIKRWLTELTRTGLKFTVSLDMTQLGFYHEYFIKVQLNDTPDPRSLKSLFADDIYSQLVVLTEGDFDLFIWAVSTSPEEYEEKFEAKIRMELDDYIEDWVAHGLLAKRHGFLPIHPNLLNKSSVLDEIDKMLLTLLIKNARVSATKLSKQLGLSKPAVIYRMQRLLKSGIIKRFTCYLPASKIGSVIIRGWQVYGKKEDFETVGRKITKLYKGVRLADTLAYAIVPDGGLDNLNIETYLSTRDIKYIERILVGAGKVTRKHEKARVKKILKGEIPIQFTGLEDLEFLLSPAEIGGP